MKTIFLDIMENGRFIKQLRYEWAALWALDLEDVERYVLDALPFLKNRDFQIEFSANKV